MRTGKLNWLLGFHCEIQQNAERKAEITVSRKVKISVLQLFYADIKLSPFEQMTQKSPFNLSGVVISLPSYVTLVLLALSIAVHLLGDGQRLSSFSLC